MSLYEDTLQGLQEAIEAGCPDIVMKVHNTRKLLGIGAYTPGGRAKDRRKAKVIYACRNADVPAVKSYIQGVINVANSRIKNPDHHVSYTVQHYHDVSHATLSGAAAHSVHTLSGQDLMNRLMSLKDLLDSRLSVAYDPGIEKEIKAIQNILPLIVPDAAYIARYPSGVTYRVSIYDTKAGHHFQANVGNVLILSGEKMIPQVSLARPRKSKPSKYDELVPAFSINGVDYYEDKSGEF